MRFVHDQELLQILISPLKGKTRLPLTNESSGRVLFPGGLIKLDFVFVNSE